MKMLNQTGKLLRFAFPKYGKWNLRYYNKCNEYKSTTMDDLPVPCGDWFTYNAKKNLGYNKVLGFGIVSFLLSLSVLRNSGIVDFNFNPPDSIDV